MSKAVRKVALVAAGAALGFVTGGVGFALIGGAVGLFVGSQQDMALKNGRAGNSEPSAQTVRSSKAPARFILGRVSTGGVLVWAQEQAGDQADGEWVHLVYVLSEGAISALEAIYLGEEEIATFGEFASYELVVNPTEVNAFLRANCPDWKDTQIGRGLSFVRLSLKHNPEKFPSGIPNVRFVVRGRNDLYDPRTGMAGYSENTALHLLWFLRVRCKVPDDEIVFETFASAANVCDESVGNPDGSSGIRYRTGCVIGADEQRTNVIQKLEESCAGQLIRVGGKWMLQAGAYYGPWDFEITEDMVIGTVSGSTEVGNDAAINVVTGTFIDPSQSWAETDFPEVRVQAWVDQDGGESAESMSLGYVTDAYQGQRLANIKLRRARAAGSLQIPMNFAGYNCRPGRVVRVNLPSLNIVGEFIVTDWNLAADDGCTVTVSQYEAAIFDDAVGQPYNPIGFINLPSGGLGSPTGLAWTVDDTAEVTQGVLSWSAPTGIVTGYAVTVRQAGVAVQAQQVPETTLQVPLAGLPSGNYTMSVAALGPQARSGEASITVNIDGPPVPEGCLVTASIDTITLTPTNVQHRLNGGTYEYFYTRDGAAPVDQAEYLGQGLSLTHTGLAFFANYFYFIRARNAYGVSGYLKVPTSTSNDVSAMLEGLEGQIKEGQLYPDLADRIDLIDGTGPGSVNERISELRDEIDDLVDALAYDPNKSYADGDSVRQGQRLYQATQAVPAAPGGENSPPNPTYWLDIGQVVESANGLAAQVEQNTASIEEQDGRITVNAERIAAVRAELDDPDTGLSATASGLSSMKSEVEIIDGKLDATAEKLDGVYVQVNPALAGTEEGFAGSEQTFVGVWSEQSARIEDGVATARRLDVVQVQQGETNASVQRVDEAVVGLDGRVSAISSWKTETNVNGKKVATGIVQGSNGEVGEIILSAQRVSIINGIDGPESNLFVFQNGQLYLNQAFINTAFIRELILGMTIVSEARNSQGLPLLEINFKAGTFTLRGQDANGSTLLNNGGLYVYDANNVERVAVGRLT